MAEAKKQQFDPSGDAPREAGAGDGMTGTGPDAMTGAGGPQPDMVDPDSVVDIIQDGLAEDGRIAQLTAERDEMRERFMRALADAENARKRGERDRREAERYGGTRLARDMLPVYDNLQRALMAVTGEQREQAAALIEGVELTLKELLAVFARHDVTVVRPEIGDSFDPQMHQAMFEAPVPDTKAGDIIQVMADGFLLHDRLLRPAQVGVSSSPAG